MKYLFGPVPSRRLGMSLGVDLVPYKYCTMNCIYCEVGGTTNLEIERAEYVPTKEVLNELDGFLSSNPKLDFVTFSGSGEPTLHSDLGKIINFLKQNYPQFKIALLTNSTLLSDKELRKDICPIDVILPSLDAVTDRIFRRINRPHPRLDPQEMISGLMAFRRECPAKMWLEIFIVPGLNNHMSELSKLKQAAESIRPDQIQINALDRPGTEDWIKKVNYQTLLDIRDFFHPLPAEIIASKPQVTKNTLENMDIEKTILDTIRRRPCTIEDLQAITGLEYKTLLHRLNQLLAKNQIILSKQERGDFYQILH